MALIGGVFSIMNSGPSNGKGPVPPPEEAPVPPPDPDTITIAGVMGPLEFGTNRQGLDMSDNGVSTENAETCSNMCPADKNGRAMTYVISLKTCWLKAGVPPAAAAGGPDYVSARKR